MKTGWETGALASISEVFTDGNWIESKDQATDGIRLVQTGNVGEGVFKERRDKARWIDEDTFARLNCFEVLPGDCLISRLPDPVGRACLIPDTGDKMITAVDCSIVRPDETKIDPRLLVYFTQSRVYLRDVDERCSGTTRRRISRENLGKVPIPLPPLEEQQRIVGVLDEAFEGLARARAHAEANLQNVRELFESIKANALAYKGPDREEVILSEVSDITSGLVDPRENDYADMLHLGAGNMITGTDELVDVKTAREEKLKSGKYLFDETTILYSKIRPYLRKAARPDFQGLCSADVYPLTPKPDRLDKDFLFHLLLGHDFTEYAISGSDRAGMPKVNRNHMFAYRFELPPIEAQRRIATAIDEAHISCSALVELANKKLQDLDDLRQSLLQKAFAGELT